MRVKEAPASALRAMFGGIGSLLGVTDKIRAKHTAPDATTTPETAAPETAAPETAAPETAAPETAALPVANYDDLSLASLRARLRNLSADQLVTLIAYEKSHADREDVVTMFERRVAKLAEG